VQEPALIQLGTKMPPFFTGLDPTNEVFLIHGRPWPRSQGAQPAEVQRVESTYGDTVEEQTRLVLDFLYEAGARGYTGVQPASVGAAPATPPATQPATQPTTQPAAAPPATATPQAEAQAAPKEQVAMTTPESSKPPEVKPAPAEEKPAAPKPAPAPAAQGKPAVSGTIKFKGEPPQMGEINMQAVPECHRLHANPPIDETVYVNDDNTTLRNVVVYVSGGLPEGEQYPAPGEPAVLNQKGCMYEPHVLAMQVGQKLIVQNSDPFLHNVHSLSNINPPFNFGQNNIDNNPGKVVDSIRAAEQFRIKCDVHPWMSAHVRVFEHPFYSVSDDKGAFALRNLPPGQYTITAWHESLGEQQKEVTVEDGKPVSVEFEFGG
jgi:hypothetical protein